MIALLCMLQIGQLIKKEELSHLSVSLRLVTPVARLRTRSKISFAGSLTNGTTRSLWLDGRLVVKVHLNIEVTDASGAAVPYPGSGTKIKLAAPRREDFVRLRKGLGITRNNIIELSFDQPGKYSIKLTASHGASKSTAEKLGIHLAPFGPPARLVIEVHK